MEPSHGLAALYDPSRTVRQVAQIVIGSPADGAHRIEGWSYAEEDQGRGRTFRWGTYPRTAFSFDLLEPGRLELVLEGLAAPIAEGGRLSVLVKANGNLAGTLELGAGLAEYRLPIAADLQRRGRNELTLDYDLRGASPLTPAGGQRGNLAVAWYRVGFDGLSGDGSVPRADLERDALFVPFGAQVDYYLPLPAGATLRADEWRFVGGGSGRLDVHLETDGATRRRLAGLTHPGPLDVELGESPSAAAKLSVAATTEGSFPAGAGIVLESPIVWSPALVGQGDEPRAPRSSPTPNIVIYLVDTLRADHLGCYGHPRAVSPNIDAFAERANLFENMRGQSSWTLPSVTSLFTGMWPVEHGVVRESERLADGALTLAEALAARGYETTAIVANGYPTASFGLAQGFENHVLVESGQRRSSLVFDEFATWLPTRESGRPFFVYMHSLDPHRPYWPLEEYRHRFAADATEIYEAIVQNPKRQKWDPTENTIAQLKALYDAEIAENDASFGSTLELLDREGLFEDSLVVFLADHGEEFHEHSAWAHGADLFRETLNVPLIIKLPGQRTGRRITTAAQHIDLMPTILDYLGLDISSFEGVSLLAATQGAAAPERARTIFSHTSKYGPVVVSAVQQDWKFVMRQERDRTLEMLFNSRRDPNELEDLSSDYPILATVMRDTIEAKLAAGQTLESEQAKPSEEVLENLRALGYIN